MHSHYSLGLYSCSLAGFTDNLNGITRLIVYLGTMAPKSVVSQLHFITQSSLFRQNILPGDTIRVPTSTLTSHVSEVIASYYSVSLTHSRSSFRINISVSLQISAPKIDSLSTTLSQTRVIIINV